MSITLGKALDKMIKKLGVEKAVQQGQALVVWNEIVGRKISIHATPEKVSYGKLYIKVDSPVWRSELSFRKEEILDRINRELKDAKIKEIILR